MGIPLNVLMLEDRPADADLVVYELRHAGFDITWKRVDNEADFNQSLTPKVDIILADYHLPQFDALRALRCLKATGLDTPFIILTGTVSEEVVLECMREGAADYLLKDRLARLGPAVHLALDKTKLDRKERKTEAALVRSEATNRAIMSSLNAHIAILDPDGTIVTVNEAWEAYARRNGDPDLIHTGPGQNYLQITRRAAEAGLADAQKALDGIQSVMDRSQETFSLEYPAHFDLNKHWFLLYVTPMPGEQRGVVITHLNITQRKLAEERLTLLSKALEAAANTVIITDRAGTIVWVNSAFTRMTGYTFSQAVGHQSTLANPKAHTPAYYEAMCKSIYSGQVWHADVVNRRKDGSTYMAEVTITPVRDENGEISHFIDIEQDITERKQHEREVEAIVVVANALRTAQTRAEMLPVILDQLLDLLDATCAAISLYDPLTDEMVMTLGRGSFDQAAGVRLPANEGLTGRIVQSRQIYFTDHTQTPSKTEPWLREDLPFLAGIPLIAHGEIIGILWVGKPTEFNATEARLLSAVTDIAANAIHRSSLFEETELRLQRLITLREVDKAITTSLNSSQALSVLVNQVVSQLSVRAADILRFNDTTQMLDQIASCGFHHEYPSTARALAHKLALEIALERRPILIPDTTQDPRLKETRLRHGGEEFSAYFGIPLIAKGQVKGVLELFSDGTLTPNAEWLNFLETLAGQAAIAIDNAELFDNLQRSNIKLAKAYDDTIESWSRALDLRDRETEGHTQRVTELTLKLARTAGFEENELVHVRRGALLHDIGKMGVPDEILHKEGPLTPDEWEIMRKHPVYAYDLLSPIDFLGPALDIPYCHHEKWDGNGYPRGLKAKGIPLAARIFSLADVYDGLISDRVYRKGWEQGKILSYIEKHAGTHFDPELTRLFLSRTWD